MPLSPEDIVKTYIDDGSSVERVNNRKSKLKIAITEPNPEWPHRFANTPGSTASSLTSGFFGLLCALIILRYTPK